MNGMDPIISDIRNCIEKQLNRGKRDFIIFPFGDVGIEVKNFLNNAYGITEKYLIDNHLCKYNDAIKSLKEMPSLDYKGCVVILASTNSKIYSDLKECIKEYFNDDEIAELDCMLCCEGEENYTTEVGKYSYGPIAQSSNLVESVGAFCSFANGSEVVVNHCTQYISTHPIISHGAEENRQTDRFTYDRYRKFDWYMPGVQPKGEIKKARRVKIGNDVWFGKNVTVTNFSNIGNGVIAGAGAVITKDVPDYAIVMGVPARIVGYRYEPEQIAALNRIQWWNWTDDEIRERYDDFYLPIEEFIRKWDVKPD